MGAGGRGGAGRQWSSLEALGEVHRAALGRLRMQEAGAGTRAGKGWDRGDGGHLQKQGGGRGEK